MLSEVIFLFLSERKQKKKNIYIYIYIYIHLWASLMAQMEKNLPAMRRPGFDPWVGKIPWRREWLLTPIFLPREKEWAEYSLWGHRESDMTEGLTLLCMYIHVTIHIHIYT